MDEHEQEEQEQEQEEEEEEDVWVCSSCTFHNQDLDEVCSMCYTTRPGFSWFLTYGRSFSICRLSGFLQNMLSGAVTGTFALVGAVSGAITGALAGRAAQCGLLRGAGLGAVAGAVLSVEVLEASRAYWHSQRSMPISLPSMSNFLDDILSGRFVQGFLAPAISATQRWQVNFAEMSYEELYEMFIPSDGRIKGASDEFLKTLPQHVITRGNLVDASGDVICCAICLQELEEGDIGRTLPPCNHTFHLSCVDRWLMKHVVCPVCRQCMH